MTPLWVEIRLRAPVAVSYRPLHLDGLLSWARVEEAIDAGHPDPWSVQHDLPVARYTAPDGRWVFQASMLAPVAASEVFQTLMTSRITTERIVRDRGGVLDTRRMTAANPAGGPFKSSIWHQGAQWMERMVGVVVGERERVEALLSRIDAVGKRRNVGFGAVASLEVREGAPATGWQWRTLPSSVDLPLEGAYAVSSACLAAPYWRRRDETDCIDPLDEAPWLVGFSDC